MHARVDQKIELLRAVMDGVKPPEERNLVAQAMGPVIGGLTHHHRGARLEPNRPSGDRSKDATRDEVVDHEHRQRNRRGENEARQKSGEEVVAKVDGDLLAEDLLAMQSEDTLNWHEDRCEDG